MHFQLRLITGLVGGETPEGARGATLVGPRAGEETPEGCFSAEATGPQPRRVLRPDASNREEARGVTPEGPLAIGFPLRMEACCVRGGTLKGARGATLEGPRARGETLEGARGATPEGPLAVGFLFHAVGLCFLLGGREPSEEPV